MSTHRSKVNTPQICSQMNYCKDFIASMVTVTSRINDVCRCVCGYSVPEDNGFYFVRCATLRCLN